MKVWIVEYRFADENGLEGIYETKEKAEKDKGKYGDPRYRFVEEWEVE